MEEGFAHPSCLIKGRFLSESLVVGELRRHICQTISRFSAKYPRMRHPQFLRGSRRSCYSLSSSPEPCSVCSEGTRLPGTRYSSLTQRPRSTSLQRSQQNGRNGLSFHSTGLPQVGHFMETDAAANTSLQFASLISGASDSGRLTRIRLLTNSILPSRRIAFKRTVTLSRVEPKMEAISR